MLITQGHPKSGSIYMEDTPKKPLKKNRILLVLLSVVFTLLVLEVICRVWINLLAPDEQRQEYSLYSELKPRERRYIPHHYLNYYPNHEYRANNTYHNSLGYRNDEFPVQKPEGVYRIVAIGGSSTYTIEVGDNEKTFTAQLEKILRDKYGYKNVQVINAGAGGYNSWESLINLELRALDLDPDLVIVYHGTNDVHTRLVEPSLYRGDNSGRREQWEEPGVNILEYSALLRIILRKTGITSQAGLRKFVNAESAYGPFELEGRDPMELLDKNPPIYFRRNLINMVAVSRANGADIMLTTWAYSPHFGGYESTPYYRRGFSENNQAVREVAYEHDVPLFEFADVMPQDKKYWADGRHVNELGARKKAELFAGFINESGIIPRSQHKTSPDLQLD